MKKKRKQLSEFLASRGFRDEDGAAERLGKSVRTLALWRDLLPVFWTEDCWKIPV